MILLVLYLFAVVAQPEVFSRFLFDGLANGSILQDRVRRLLALRLKMARRERPSE
jgi:hypothetical protein